MQEIYLCNIWSSLVKHINGQHLIPDAHFLLLTFTCISMFIYPYPLIKEFLYYVKTPLIKGLSGIMPVISYSLHWAPLMLPSR